MSQPLFHSWQIQHMGSPISWEAWARQGRVKLQHLRDIILSLMQPALQQEVNVLLDSMPASWAAHVCGPSPQPTHMASATAVSSAQTQRVSSAPPQPEAGQQHPRLCRLTPSPCHVLGPQQALASSPHGTCCRRNSGSGTASASARASSQPSPRRCLIIDPRSWGFGSEPTHEYVVRTRASRLRALRRIIAGLPDAVSSMRPAIWPAEYGDEHSGIQRLESRWALSPAASASARCPRSFSHQRSTRPIH